MSKTRLSNIEVVVIAVYRLGGEANSVDTEDVAIEADRLAPSRFAWRKYPEQISIEHIRVFLSDAKKPKNGALLSGGGAKGWRLTSDGLRLARLREPDASGQKSPRTDRERDRRRRVESVRLMDLSAFRKFSEGGDVTNREAEAVFRIDDYVLESRRSQLIERYRMLFADDSDLGPFVEKMAALLRFQS